MTSAPAMYRKSHSIPSPIFRTTSSGLAARNTRPPPASTSTRTGTVRTANSVSSCSATRRSDDAGGAATSEGASARGGAGMNDDDRGFSPFTNQVAEIVPPDWTRGRERRERFFSALGGGGRGGMGAAFAAALWTGADGLATTFAAGRPFATSRAAVFGGFVGRRFGAAAAFFAGRFEAVFGRATRGIAFLTGRLRALTVVFFACAFA